LQCGSNDLSHGSVIVPRDRPAARFGRQKAPPTNPNERCHRRGWKPRKETFFSRPRSSDEREHSASRFVSPTDVSLELPDELRRFKREPGCQPEGAARTAYEAWAPNGASDHIERVTPHGVNYRGPQQGSQRVFGARRQVLQELKRDPAACPACWPSAFDQVEARDVVRFPE
jgi:hypothetical protein